jgi:hypothetical protein
MHPAHQVLYRALLAFSNDKEQAHERAWQVLHRLTDENIITGGTWHWHGGVYTLDTPPIAKAAEPPEPQLPPRPDRVIIDRMHPSFDPRTSE